MCEALRELMKEEIEEELKKSRDKAIQEGLAQGLEQGLEQGIEQGIEQGLQQGIEQGIEQGRINQLIDLVMQNLLPIETAAQCAKMTLDEFKVAIENKDNKLAIQVIKIASVRENIFPSTGYLLLLLKNSNIGQRRRYS